MMTRRLLTPLALLALGACARTDAPQFSQLSSGGGEMISRWPAEVWRRDDVARGVACYVYVGHGIACVVPVAVARPDTTRPDR